MKLGELLVRDGRISEAQVERALAQQSKEGGRMGTLLCDTKALELETLSGYLGIHLGIPVATGAMLERAKKSALRLLTPTQAFRHRCVPLMVQDGQLIAAVENPHAFETLEAVSEATGYRVIPRVAPEVRIYYYLERYYGVPRPARFLRYGDEPRGEDGPSEAPTTVVLPGLPPRHSVAPPRTAAVQLRRGTVQPAFDESEALELDASDLEDEMENDASGRMTAPQPASTDVSAPHAPGPAATTVMRAAVPPFDFAAATLAIGAAQGRTEIATALLGYASTVFEMAILFVVRDGMAYGWNATGTIENTEHIDHLLIPMDAATVLKAAVTSDDFLYDGDLVPNSLHSHLFRIVGYPDPKRVVTATVQLRSRVVNALLGHRRADAPLGAAQRLELVTLCKEAAAAYGRLLMAGKKPAA